MKIIKLQNGRQPRIFTIYENDNGDLHSDNIVFNKNYSFKIGKVKSEARDEDEILTAFLNQEYKKAQRAAGKKGMISLAAFQEIIGNQNIIDALTANAWIELWKEAKPYQVVFKK